MASFPLKSAKKWPKKNYIPPFNSGLWALNPIFTVTSPYTMTGTNLVAGQQYSNTITIEVKEGRRYTVTMPNIETMRQRIRVGRGSNGALIGATSVGFPVCTFTVPAGETSIQILVDNIGNNGNDKAGGTITFSNIQMEEGNTNTSFEVNEYTNRIAKRYNGVNKNAVKIPKKNYIVPFTDVRWTYPSNFTPKTATRLEATFPDVTPLRAVLNVKVKPGKQYTVSASYDITKARIRVARGSNDNLIGNTSGANKYTFTVPNTETSINIGLDNNDGAQWVASGLVVIENLQLEEGGVQTSFEQNEMINRPLIGLPKAPKKVYPFSFQRDSIDVLDDTVFGLSIPRTKNGLLFMEEATTNLWTGERSTMLNFSTVTQDGWVKLTNVAAGTTGNSGLRNLVTVAKLTNAQLYSCSATVYNPHDYPVDVHQDWCDNGHPNPNITTLQPKETRRISITASRSSYDSTYRFYDIAVEGNGNTIWIKDVQIENKSYPTSYTPNDRRREILQFDNGGSFVDPEKGSIEMEFIATLGESTVYSSATSPQYGLHDINYYTTPTNGGFIVRRNSDVLNRVVFITTDANGTPVLANIFLDWDNGNTIKYRVEWDRAEGYFRLYINDELKYSHATMWKAPVTVQPFQIGCRGKATENHGTSNAIYKSIVIRDRNNLATFEL